MKLQERFWLITFIFLVLILGLSYYCKYKIIESFEEDINIYNKDKNSNEIYNEIIEFIKGDKQVDERQLELLLNINENKSNNILPEQLHELQRYVAKITQNNKKLSQLGQKLQDNSDIKSKYTTSVLRAKDLKLLSLYYDIILYEMRFIFTNNFNTIDKIDELYNNFLNYINNNNKLSSYKKDLAYITYHNKNNFKELAHYLTDNQELKQKSYEILVLLKQAGSAVQNHSRTNYIEILFSISLFTCIFLYIVSMRTLVFKQLSLDTKPQKLLPYFPQDPAKEYYRTKTIDQATMRANNTGIINIRNLIANLNAFEREITKQEFQEISAVKQEKKNIENIMDKIQQNIENLDSYTGRFYDLAAILGASIKDIQDLTEKIHVIALNIMLITNKKIFDVKDYVGFFKIEEIQELTNKAASYIQKLEEEKSLFQEGYKENILPYLLSLKTLIEDLKASHHIMFEETKTLNKDLDLSKISLLVRDILKTAKTLEETIYQNEYMQEIVSEVE